MVFRYTANRMNKIMVRINIMVILLAVDHGYFFKNISFSREKKNIQLRVGYSITNEMVVRVVVERNSCERKINAES